MEATLGTRRVDQQYIMALLLAVLITIALEAMYYYAVVGGERDETPARAVAVTAVVAVITSCIVWFLTHKAYEAGSAAELGSRSLILGCLAVLSVLGMWLGIFGPICFAAVLFGQKAVAAGRTKQGYFGMTLGVLAFAASAILLVTAV